MGRVIWLLSLFLFLASLHVFGSEPVDCSFLLSGLLKNSKDQSFALSNLSDLSATTPPSFDFISQKVLETQSIEERFKAISDLPLEKVIAAPGHRFLRKPEQVGGLAKYINENNGGNFQHDKILINIVTQPDGKIKSVDLWNAHHRFLAYLLAGYKKIGQLDLKNVDILVNGVQSWGETWGHYLPAAGVDLKKFNDYKIVPVGGDIRLGTISLSGRLSNYELGSRNTIGQLMKNTMRENKPKIGLYFGTFDPIHEGHLQVAKIAKESAGLDEVLVTPNLNSVEKPDASEAHHRITMSGLRIEKEEGLNLYTGDSSNLIDVFGREPFFERVGQIYGTKTIYQVVGQDRFESLVEQGVIYPGSSRVYLVSPRGGASKGFSISEELKNVAILLPLKDDQSLSSTEIRRKIKSGIRPSDTELDPVLHKYIQKHHLYR